MEMASLDSSLKRSELMSLENERLRALMLQFSNYPNVLARLNSTIQLYPQNLGGVSPRPVVGRVWATSGIRYTTQGQKLDWALIEFRNHDNLQDPRKIENFISRVRY